MGYECCEGVVFLKELHNAALELGVELHQVLHFVQRDQSLLQEEFVLRLKWHGKSVYDRACKKVRARLSAI